VCKSLITRIFLCQTVRHELCRSEREGMNLLIEKGRDLRSFFSGRFRLRHLAAASSHRGCRA